MHKKLLRGRWIFGRCYEAPAIKISAYIFCIYGGFVLRISGRAGGRKDRIDSVTPALSGRFYPALKSKDIQPNPPLLTNNPSIVSFLALFNSANYRILLITFVVGGLSFIFILLQQLSFFLISAH